MTISVDHYFKTRKSDRKKETRYLAVINKDNCTSCNACASAVPGGLHLRGAQRDSLREFSPD